MLFWTFLLYLTCLGALAIAVDSYLIPFQYV